ncbi:hypothetical protein FNV43_RR00024 [Rhamnella rubrinervis]|uniref:Ubiquitin-like protease family profile domain-containing protein n=1 Tax=Rhamnella rubrinervis TaxID=2594499 RepID=A0A8K0HPK4_9ROSA|nr:hypothetical protein FNV43_RR00024 [Rhamnella rubrinervis]
MDPLKRLKKASDKSTKATTVTEAAAMNKRSREVEESSNALQVSRRIIPEGVGDIAHLTVISNLQVGLKVIYNKLQKGIDQFEISIFGDITRMKTVQFSDRSRLVKKNNFKIIENDNLLKKHPWGNLCYDLTISSLRSKMKAGKYSTSYSLYGFPLAFQIWGFHMIPMVPTMTPLGAFLGVRYPRMLGYQFPNILHYNRLANDIFNKKQYIVNNELIPTEEELQKTYMVNTQSQPESAPSQHLEGMINELREDFANMWADFGLQLEQQGKISRVEDNGGLVVTTSSTTANVDIPSRHIILYDSAIKMTPKLWFQIKNARPLVVLFLYLLMVNEYYTHHPDQTLDLTPFRMTREKDSSLPQQISDGDCGVYALKYIEYLIAGRPFDFNSSHIGEICCGDFSQ